MRRAPSPGSTARPHSPLTFGDIDSTQADLSDGAYPRGPVGSAQFDQVHNIGEVWAGMLWEVRARFVQRLGHAAGNQRMLQFVTDGMKLDPTAPTMLQARDAIIAAANAGGGTAADIADIWAGFATRGMGTLAQVINPGTGAINSTRVVESYLTPAPDPSFSINDVTTTEGNAGTTIFGFTVTLAHPSAAEHRVSFITADGTALAGDYQSTSGQLIFPPGATSMPVNVTVNGDVTGEPNETFFVNLFNPVNGVIDDAQGVGTILNDDAGGPIAPTAVNDAFATAFYTALTITGPGVLANDNTNGGGAMTAALVAGPAHGTLALGADGGFIYTPTWPFVGADAFTYQAVNAAGPGNVATVTLSVAAPTTVQPPFNFRVDAVSGSTVTLRWDTLTVGPQASVFFLEGGLAPGEVLASIPTAERVEHLHVRGAVGIVLHPHARAAGRGQEPGVERDSPARERAGGAVGSGQPAGPGQWRRAGPRVEEHVRRRCGHRIGARRDRVAGDLDPAGAVRQLQLRRRAAGHIHPPPPRDQRRWF